VGLWEGQVVIGEVVMDSGMIWGVGAGRAPVLDCPSILDFGLGGSYEAVDLSNYWSN
jgi:hypothetical protein